VNVQAISGIMQKEEGRACAAMIATLADKACKGLLTMPDDLRPDPTQIHHAIHRIRGCLPEVSPFETVGKARKDLEVALKQYRASGLLSEV
jgi:hypothetical protein